MGEPFRGAVVESGFAMRFSNHIGIAEDLLEQIERIPEWLARLERGDGITQYTVESLAKQWAQGWQGVWDQLGQARALIAAQGRDVSAYDRACANVGDLYLGAAEAKTTQLGRAVELGWRNVPTRPAHEAIGALRAAVPEIVVQKQAPIEVDLEPAGNKVLAIAGVLLGLAVLGWLLFHMLAA